MLNSTNASHVTSAVTVLAANAQALGAVTIVRALADCKGTLVSNELYAQVCTSLCAAVWQRLHKCMQLYNNNSS